MFHVVAVVHVYSSAAWWLITIHKPSIATCIVSVITICLFNVLNV